MIVIIQLLIYHGHMIYEDGFIHTGSVTGQCYWSTLLNIPQAKISVVTWISDVSQ